MLKTLSFIANHPLTRNNRLRGFARLARWQVQSRLQREVQVGWINGARLLVSNGMTGATGNIYCGLHEFPEMAFLLHMLRPDDLFVDVGANIGSYTVLAAAVAGAKAVAIEPDPHTMQSLRRNLYINEIEERVTTIEAAIGDAPGTVRFTVGLDTINHVVSEGGVPTREVPMETLDGITESKEPTFIKLDVEGFEAAVLAGGHKAIAKSSLLAVATESISDDVVAPLTAAGFTRMHYAPFSRAFTNFPQHRESNALFIRDVERVQSRLRGAPTYSAVGTQF